IPMDSPMRPHAGAPPGRMLAADYTDFAINDITKKHDTDYGMTYSPLRSTWQMGRTPVKFHDDAVQVGNRSYEATVGLFELLFRKRPNMRTVNLADEQAYREILAYKSAHKYKHDPNERIRF